MSDVFISYSLNDRAYADEVCGYLEAKGLSCWKTPGRIVPGSEWAVKHNEAISSMKVFVLIYSGSSTASSENSSELYLAAGRNDVLVIPYRIDETPLSDTYRAHLENAEWVNAYGDEDRQKALDKLYRLAAGHLAGYSAEKAENSDAAEAPVPEENTDGKKKKEKKKVPLPVVIVSVFASIVIFGGIALIASDGKLKNELFDMIDGVYTDNGEIKLKANQLVFYDKVYEGEYRGDVNEDGIADGTGHFSGVRSDNSSISLEYSGSIVNGRPCGEGKSVFANSTKGFKETYEGSFEDGIYKGYGISTYANSSNEKIEKTVSEGVWDDDDLAPGGKVTDYYFNGKVRIFTGELVNGHFSGKGTLQFIYPEDDEKETGIVEGSWTDGNLTGDIKDTTNFKNGKVKIYEGGVTDNLWEGKGVLTIIPGPTEEDVEKRVFEGVWTEDLLTGNIKWTEYKTNGDTRVYEGEYSNDNFNGNGTMTANFVSGDISKKTISGTWQSGKPKGSITEEIFYSNGDKQTYKGEYNGKKWSGEGVCTYTYASGEKKVQEGVWDKNTLVSGTVTQYDKDGKVIGTKEIKEEQS